MMEIPRVPYFDARVEVLATSSSIADVEMGLVAGIVSENDDLKALSVDVA